MANVKPRERVSILYLLVFVLLIVLSILQRFSWFQLRNWGVLAIYCCIFFLPMFFYRKKRRLSFKTAYKTGPFKFKYLPFIFFFTITVSAICCLINAVMVMMYSRLDGGFAATAVVGFTTKNPLMIFLIMALLPAVTEEFLLRGIVMREYECYGTLSAVLVSSLVFSLLHVSPFQIVSLFVAGVAYAVLALLFDSIWPAVIAHVIHNSVVALIYYYNDFVSYILGDRLFLVIFLVALFVILLIALKLLENVLAERGKNGKVRGYRGKGKGIAPLKSVSFWIFVAGCIAKMVLRLTNVF